MANFRLASQNPVFRSALRFAITIVVVDVLLLGVFGSTSAALLGSFAVAIHLYFLDFDGDVRERFIGQGTATLIGAIAVVLGVLCAQPLWLAVASALVISSLFAYARVLRGYVARSAVGLQGAFFLPLMIPAHPNQLLSLLGGWLLGSAVAILAALIVLPHRRSGVVRLALANWLRAAAGLARAVSDRQTLETAVAELARCRNELLGQVTGSYTRPGAVSKRQRALASMVAGARWSMPVAHQILPQHTNDNSVLAKQSELGFLAAAQLVSGENIDVVIPDLPLDRSRDLVSLAGQNQDIVRQHYPARLLSIAAMVQLYRAAQTRGKIAPTPDVGSMPDENPLNILWANLRWKSLWLHNALRTGFGAAACVFIVRMVGLDHGLWVIIAALSVTQITFSANAGTKAMFKIVGGAVGGVLIASVIMLFHLPYPVFLIALPISAFVAKRLQVSNIFFAQMSYTPFALINLSVLVWPPHKGLEILRIEDILLGAVVAAGFTILVFPLGINRVVTELQQRALASARSYLSSAVALVGDQKLLPGETRDHCLSDIRAYEDALDAAYMSARVESPELRAHETASALARDFLIGGDTCTNLAEQGQNDPRLVPVGRELAGWWKDFLHQENKLSA